MKKIFILALLLVSLLLHISCAQKSEYSQRTIYALDTVIELSAAKADSDSLDECQRLISSLESELSPSLDGSAAARFDVSPDGISDMPQSLLDVITVSLDVYEKTDGKYNPALGALVSLWDIPHKKAVPPQNKIDNALRHISADSIKIDGRNLLKDDPLVSLSLGGSAKGYVCQKAVEYLAERSGYGIVSFGGNIGCWGAKPNGEMWKIAVKNPFDTSKNVGILEISDGYVSVSGDYERYFEIDGKRYHHIFNPSTGYPADSGIKSAAVYSHDGTLADALSTAVFVMGIDGALELYNSGVYDFEAVMIAADGTTILTDGIKNNFFESSE